MFFLSLNNAATAVVDDSVGPSPESLIASYDAALQALAQNVETQSLPVDLSAEVAKQLEAAGLGESSLVSQVAELQKQIEGLAITPLTEVGAILAFLSATASAPVTKTADFTVATTENWLINNKSGSTCVVTMPAAASFTGRQVTIKNLQAQLVNSASSNVVPIDSASAGTAILLPVIGNWATMVSDGTNWVIMQQAPNNILLLE